MFPTYFRDLEVISRMIYEKKFSVFLLDFRIIWVFREFFYQINTNDSILKLKVKIFLRHVSMS